MTDNEKRAHDLSIALLNRIMDMDMQASKQKQLDSGQTDIHLETNPHEVYMRIYKPSLSFFNREFPNNQ